MGNFVSYISECLYRHDNVSKIKYLEQKLFNAEQKIEFMFEEFERGTRNCCLK